MSLSSKFTALALVAVGGCTANEWFGPTMVVETNGTTELRCTVDGTVGAVAFGDQGVGFKMTGQTGNPTIVLTSPGDQYVGKFKQLDEAGQSMALKAFKACHNAIQVAAESQLTLGQKTRDQYGAIYGLYRGTLLHPLGSQ